LGVVFLTAARDGRIQFQLRIAVVFYPFIGSFEKLRLFGGDSLLAW